MPDHSFVYFTEVTVVFSVYLLLFSMHAVLNDIIVQLLICRLFYHRETRSFSCIYRVHHNRAFAFS